MPLYSNPTPNKPNLFSQHESGGERVPNIAPKVIEALKAAFKKQPTPEEIFYYIYAVLYSNAYRKKYAEFLKTDFPRAPFTKDYKLFNKLAENGEELVELHLLKSKKLIKPIARCEGSGDLRVVKLSYDAKEKRVYINPEKYFAGVPPEVWGYHIGGYQVSEKWLKDRKGKGLSSEQVAHYTKVVTAIAETISIQRFLDDLFEKVETSLLEMTL
jgi:predicted helicase